MNNNEAHGHFPLPAYFTDTADALFYVDQAANCGLDIHDMVQRGIVPNVIMLEEYRDAVIVLANMLEGTSVAIPDRDYVVGILRYDVVRTVTDILNDVQSIALADDNFPQEMSDEDFDAWMGEMLSAPEYDDFDEDDYL